MFDSNAPLSFEPIGYVHCAKIYPQDASKQSIVDKSSDEAEIRLKKGFEQALDDIEGFSHLWIVYLFHRNHDWKSKVMPPRFSEIKRGVFSTRSPYRPNPIGLSCVELSRREGLSLWIRQFDLLNETPILDIKPYLSYADSFPLATTGWMQLEKQTLYSIEWQELALEQLAFLKSHGIRDLQSFVENQLSSEPLNARKKRLLEICNHSAILCYRTWRIKFSLSQTPNSAKIQVQHLTTGYTRGELAQDQDPYLDKNIHRQFLDYFQNIP